MHGLKFIFMLGYAQLFNENWVLSICTTLKKISYCTISDQLDNANLLRSGNSVALYEVPCDATSYIKLGYKN